MSNFYVIGIIDHNDAIHYEKIFYDDKDYKDHSTFWPLKNKRWRFEISDWNLTTSVLSADGFSEIEKNNIIDLMRRKFTPPDWFIRGEIWEKHGFPRTGKKYDVYWKELEEKGLTNC